MKILSLSILLFISYSLLAQVNRIMYDNTHSQNISYGECDKAGFTTGEFAGWFAEEYELYMVNDKVFDRSYEIKFDSIYVFLGTWCDDSHREVPRFVKIMEHEYFAGVPVSYFCLDGNKTTDIIEVEEYYLQFVPTFVFYYRGEELCRIVELPKDSLEEDIMDLLGRIQP